MSTDVSPNFTRNTQNALGQFVKKPPLTEKLLSKPPFRYLHDIIIAVMKTTHFFEGLFSDHELISENVKDREKKIEFLNKVIKVICIVTETQLTVKPSKIIAGQEPEKTNELLQKLGEALQKNLKSTEAVQTVLKELKSPDSQKGSNKTQKEKGLKTENKISNDKRNGEKHKKTPLTEQVAKKLPKVDTAKTKAEVQVPKAESKSKNGARKPPKKERDSEKKEGRSKEDVSEISIKSSNGDSNKITNGTESKAKEKITTEDPLNDVKQSKVNRVDTLDTDESSNEILDRDESESHAEIIPRPESMKPKPSAKLREAIVNPEKSATETLDGDIVSRPESNKSKFSAKLREVENAAMEKLSDPIPKQDSKKQKASAKSRNEAKIENSATEKSEGDTVPKHESKKQKASAKPRDEIKVENATIEKQDRDHVPKIKQEVPPAREKLQSGSVNRLKESKKQTEEPKENSNTSAGSKINKQKSLENKQNQFYENNKRPVTSLRPPSVRPSSSRPGAPRFRDSNVDIVGIDVVGKEKVKIIIEDHDKKKEDDEDSVTIESNVLETTENGFSNFPVENTAGSGHLVQQILATQKELTGDANKVKIEWEYGARREREASSKEIELLKSNLQSLSRVANPIGKLVEYAQEDVEIMRQELLHWREARKHADESLRRQDKLIEKAVQPLESKLKSIENSIAEHKEMILTLKVNIQNNKKKIRRLTGGDSLQ